MYDDVSLLEADSSATGAFAGSAYGVEYLLYVAKQFGVKKILLVTFYKSVTPLHNTYVFASRFERKLLM